MRRYALRDDQWERIKDLLPGREGHVGVTARNNRLRRIRHRHVARIDRNKKLNAAFTD
jgi:transposase